MMHGNIRHIRVQNKKAGGITIMEKLLILNPGSTSTKIAYYEDEKQIFVESISHSADEIAKYDLIVDQYEFRKDMIMEVLKEKNVKLED